MEYIWVSRYFSQRLTINFDIAAEQALDTGIYIICSRVYPVRLHNPVLIVSFQVRYVGLASVMYVYACRNNMFNDH